jgi:predicted ATPase/transcriptional regulator with XRE-family HTH domain
MPDAERSFSAALRILRERAGLTQEELANRAGLTPHAISALERGVRTRPYPHTVRSLAEALELDAVQRSALHATVPGRGPTPARVMGSAVESLTTATLPAPPTSLLGRDDEVAALANILGFSGVRLVTLTGLGGVGKSRLSIAVAQAAGPHFRDGVAWVPLAALADPALVLPTIGRAIGLSNVEGLDTATVIVEALRPRQLLLVVDNVEHLLPAAPHLVSLLESCPELSILASSRAPLKVRGEREHPVRPLSVPDARSAHPGLVSASPAGALFMARARDVRPDFEITPDNAEAVARLCERVAGLPLALELAAARVRLLEPAALLARLELVLATGGARDLPARQSTMQATLDWSYELLDPAEQRLFRRVGVFVGGFTLAAAEAVAGSDVLDGLERLVEHSLVLASPQPAGGMRYHLLEPVLQYARSRLSEEESRDAFLRHAHYYLSLAEANARAYRRREAVEALATTAREDGNLEAALERTLSLGEGELTGRLCFALWLYWWLRGHLMVGRRFAREALAMPLSAPIRVGALLTHAAMAFAQGDMEGSAPGWAEAAEIGRRETELQGQAHGTAGQALVAIAEGDWDAAEHLLAEATALSATGLDDDQWLWSLTHIWRGTVRLSKGDPEQAVVLVDTGIGAARARGDRLVIYIGLFTASQAALALGDAAAARGNLEEGIRLSRETGDLANLAYFVEALAVVEGTAEGGPARARRVAVMLGAAEALRERVGALVYGYYKPDEALRESVVQQVRSLLGKDRYDDAVDEGRGLEPDEVTAVALAGGPRLRLAEGTSPRG